MVIVVFSVLVLVHELGHLFAARRAGIRVEAFSVGMGKRVVGLKIGDTDYRLSLIPFGGYCKMAGEEPGEASGERGELASSPPGHRFWVMAAGSITNYLFAFLIFWGIFMIGVPTLTNEVGTVLKGYPAEKAGIVPGDTILAINGDRVAYWDDVVKAIARGSSAERSLHMEVERSGVVMPLDVKPQISTVKNVFGQTISRPLIGISPVERATSVRYSFLRAGYEGGRKLLELTAMTYKGIWLIFTGGMPLKTSVSGPIGIAHMMKDAAALGVVPLLIIMAHVSMALAVFNLLPFPILDGGHIIFLGIEKLRGKPLSVRTQERVTNVALAMLVGFALFVSFQDVMKFWGK